MRCKLFDRMSVRRNGEELSSNEYTCCLCCHVRMGTVFLGVFSLVKNLLCVTILAALTIMPELASEQPSVISSYLGLSDLENDSFVSSTAVSSSLVQKGNWDNDKYLALLMMIGCSVLAISLLYGTITGKPKYILPYFWLQLFDFCITALSVIGFFSYGQDIKHWIEMGIAFPLKEELLQLGREWLLVLAAFASVVVLWTKAYCICVVWSCYKYLTCRLLSAAAAGIETIYGQNFEYHSPPINDSTDVAGNAQMWMMLPPKYEEISVDTTTHGYEASSDILPPPYETIKNLETDTTTPTRINN